MPVFGWKQLFLAFFSIFSSFFKILKDLSWLSTLIYKNKRLSFFQKNHENLDSFKFQKWERVLSETPHLLTLWFQPPPTVFDVLPELAFEMVHHGAQSGVFVAKSKKIDQEDSARKVQFYNKVKFLFFGYFCPPWKLVLSLLFSTFFKLGYFSNPTWKMFLHLIDEVRTQAFTT